MIISERLKTCLATATHMVAFTGAGISAESGVPTFRGADGIWNKMRPEELASMDGFLRNPDLVWEWYAHRKRIIAEVQPNAGHVALARMERCVPDFIVITQNIDNLHRRAGSTKVHELHGNIERNYCIACGRRYSNEEVLKAVGVPRCAACNGKIRPDVVWFGEMLPEDEWEASVRATESAKARGAYLVEINPEPTPLTERADEFLQGSAGTILPLLYDILHDARKVSA